MPNVPAQVRGIERDAALDVLKAIHRYADSGDGDVKPLSGKFEGYVRLRIGRYRVIFEQTEDTISIHRVADRRDAYR